MLFILYHKANKNSCYEIYHIKNCENRFFFFIWKTPLSKHFVILFSITLVCENSAQNYRTFPHPYTSTKHTWHCLLFLFYYFNELTYLKKCGSFPVAIRSNPIRTGWLFGYIRYFSFTFPWKNTWLVNFIYTQLILIYFDKHF